MATKKIIDTRYCQCCKSMDKDFTKIVTLKNSGLLLYIHENTSLSKTKWSGTNKDSLILHNSSDKDLKRFDYIAELCQYKTNCYYCKKLIQRARSLLEDMTTIRKNEVIGVCELCKRSHRTNKCKRCEYIINKFISDKVRRYEDRKELMKSWFCKVRNFLVSILEGKIICKHVTNVGSESKTQLNTLLNLLKFSAPIRELDIDTFPKSDRKMLNIEDQEINEQVLDKILTLLKPGTQNTTMAEASYDSLFEEQNICICRYLMDYRSKPSLALNTSLDKNISNKQSLEMHNIGSKMENVEQRLKKNDGSGLNVPGTDLTLSQTIKHELKPPKIELSSNNEKQSKNKPKNLQKQSYKTKTNANNKVIGKSSENIKLDRNKVPTSRNEIQKYPKPDNDLLEMMKMLKKNNRKQNEKGLKKEPLKVTASIVNLPTIKHSNKHNENNDIESLSQSFIQCRSKQRLQPLEMIKGNEIVEFDSQYKNVQVELIKPLLFKTENFITPETNKSLIIAATPLESAKSRQKEKKVQDYSGIVTYELSNREFIDKGWTKLPTTKIMRRMNIYKMKPSSCNWFTSHNDKDKKIRFYDTGEKLAEINENGCGKWFYKNGNVALDYYNSEGEGNFSEGSLVTDIKSSTDKFIKILINNNRINTDQRCVIYSSGDLDEAGKNKPVTILACFDKLGNGVIYDHYGSYRLKYNQSEGIVIDPKIGPPGRWKWHTLNDPPVLQQVFINTFVKNPLLEGPSSPVVPKKCGNDEMYAIEIKNFLNEKATKMLQKFKPFKIRMKVIKMNDCLSIRIIDQADIYVLYRCGPICLKLNIGMTLISNEIIDTEVAEVSEVSTPYDQKLPRSGSLQTINHIISRAKLSKYKYLK